LVHLTFHDNHDLWIAAATRATADQIEWEEIFMHGSPLKLRRLVAGLSRTGGQSAQIWIHTGRYSAFDTQGDDPARSIPNPGLDE
jgi:hypothetical protein